MTERILITGASGNIGSMILERLLKTGKNLVAAVRDVEKAKKKNWDANRVEIKKFDYFQPSSWSDAFLDVDQLVLISPPLENKAAEMLNPVITYAKAQNIQKIIMISALNVEKNEKDPLRIIEQNLENSELNYTILRCNWFMQNFLTTFRDSIQDSNTIQAPAGTGKVSFIDTRDIAKFVDEIFQNNKYDRKVFHLTGNEALGFTDIANIFSKILGRNISYISMTEEDARLNFIGWGLLSENVNLALKLYAEIRQGWAEMISTDYKDIMHQDPITFEQFVTDFKPTWNEICGFESLECR